MSNELSKEQIEALRALILPDWQKRSTSDEILIGHLNALCDLAPPALEPSPEREGLNAWLIERGQPENQIPTIWWIENDPSRKKQDRKYGGRWTEDANKAAKFATREEAEIEAEHFVYHAYHVCEHVFLSPLTPPAPRATEQAETDAQKIVRLQGQRAVIDMELHHLVCGDPGKSVTLPPLPKR